jgi:signal transduction histidine kinase/ActR/RegA family two-component response regulator
VSSDHLRTGQHDSLWDQAPAPKAANPLLSLRLLGVLLVVLPVVVYALVGIYRYQNIRAETELRLDRSLRIALEHALKVLDTTDMTLIRVLDVLGDSDDDAIDQRQALLHRQLRSISAAKPQMDSIWVQSSEGRPLVTDRFNPVPPGLNFSDRDYFRWHRANPGNKSFVSEPMLGRATGVDLFVMSRGRYLADESFTGSVTVSLIPAYFQNFHSDLAADEPGLAITMLREDGVILTRWPPVQEAPARLSPQGPVLSLIKSGHSSGRASGVSSVDGRERLLTFGQVGNYPVYLGTGMDMREITKRWMAEMAWLAAFGLPPLLGLFVAARMTFRRTRDALASAQKLPEETITRRRAEEALRQAQKLEALGRLTGGVAHDFNNALMVISNNVFLLKRKHPDADGPQLESISRAISSATKLTRQLLAFSRRQALVPEHMRLQDRLPGMRDLLHPVLGSQIELGLEVAPDTRPILIDSAEFELALINLAINARDAMPAGGRFQITARDAAGDLPPPLAGPVVMVEASDSGTGIDPDVLDKVFEPFFTTKPVGQGTGLGLSQIYGLCQRAGGLATIRSQPGAGTTVTLYFPAAAPQSGQAADPPRATGRHLGKRILLVEDNEEVAAALQPVLEAMGCSVTHLDRGAKARDWLQASAHLIDLLLTDVVMPGEMDGLALAQFARRTFPGLKIILMTGYAEQLETISRQGYEIIPKPCSADMLGEVIQRVTATALPAPIEAK